MLVVPHRLLYRCVKSIRSSLRILLVRPYLAKAPNGTPSHLFHLEPTFFHHSSRCQQLNNKMTDSSPPCDLSATMKAWRFHSARGGAEKHMRLEDMDVPDPQPTNSTLVKVVAVSLNPVDIKFSETPIVGSFMHPLPAIPGCDGVGRVLKTTDPSLRQGMMVQFRKKEMQKDGALAEYVCLARGECAVIPDGVSPTQAVTVGTCGVTAYQAISPYILGKDGQEKHAETPRVFINGGSGGAGSFQIQVAKILGCYVVTSCSTSNVELCRGLGADEVIDYKMNSVEEILTQMVKEDISKAFDLVVDNVDKPWRLFKAGDVYLKKEGTYVQIGGDVSAQTVKELLYIKCLPGFLGGAHSNWTFMGMKTSREDSERILKWMEEGRIRVPIDSEFGWQEVPEAYSKLKSGKTKGKVIVNVSE